MSHYNPHFPSWWDELRPGGLDVLCDLSAGCIEWVAAGAAFALEQQSSDHFAVGYICDFSDKKILELESGS